MITHPCHGTQVTYTYSCTFMCYNQDVLFFTVVTFPTVKSRYGKNVRYFQLLNIKNLNTFEFVKESILYRSEILVDFVNRKRFSKLFTKNKDIVILQTCEILRVNDKHGRVHGGCICTP